MNADDRKAADELHAMIDARLRAVRDSRDAALVERTLADVAAAARGTDNLMPPILAAVKAYATVGEICRVLADVFGEYEQPETHEGAE